MAGAADLRRIQRELQQLRTRVALLAARAAVRRVDDTEKMQTLQADLLAGNTKDGIEHFQHYGFTSKPRPPSGSMGPEGIGLALGGSRAHTAIICVDDRRYRLKALEDGEVALYDDQGQVVKLGRSLLHVKGTTKVKVEAPDVDVVASGTIKLDAPNVHVTGNLGVDGDVEAGGNVEADGDVSDLSGTAQTMAAMRTTYNAHVHVTLVAGVPWTSNAPNPPAM